MSIEIKFYEALSAEQMRCATPAKMPYLCIAGFLDFDLLRDEVTQRLTKALTAMQNDPARNWDPEAASAIPAFGGTSPHDILRVNEEGSSADSQASNLEQHAELNRLPQDVAHQVQQEIIGFDKRQLESQTQWFEFCGCKIFRALSVQHGFIFA